MTGLSVNTMGGEVKIARRVAPRCKDQALDSWRQKPFDVFLINSHDSRGCKVVPRRR